MLRQGLWHPAPVSYADYAREVPVTVQVLISVLLTAGISVGLVRIFHRQLLAIAQGPQQGPDDHTPKPPSPELLIERIIQVLMFGFIFLFTFTMGQFIVNARNAEASTQDEIVFYGRAITSAQDLPADAGRDAMLQALERYGMVVSEQQWPLMEDGDFAGAYALQAEAASAVADGVRAAQSAGAAEAASWGVLATAIDEMLLAATDRLSTVPSSSAATLLLTVLILGVLSLAMTAVFLPVRLGLNLVLIGLMGATYGFLFYVVVELSNPFQGNGSIAPFDLFSS